MIQLTQMFPVLVSENLGRLKSFYSEHFGFQAVFYDPEFYLHLMHSQSGVQLGFLVPDHPSQPRFLHSLASQKGMVISFEVPKIESAYTIAIDAKLEMVMELKEENWGQKHFMIRDPQGFVIDIIEDTRE